MAGLTETERVRRYYDEIADTYDARVAYYERYLVDDGRQWVCGQATGDTLEIGVGTGRNLPYYPAEARLVGIDLNPVMLALAKRRAAALGRSVDLRVGDAQSLDLPEAAFDTVVATLALSSVPDDRGAIGEAQRVLRPGGRFLLLDHVRSPLLPVRAIQRLLDPISVRLHANHLLRDPIDTLERQGFVTERLERSKLGLIARVSARKPAPSAD